jgi:hypothetical protein
MKEAYKKQVALLLDILPSIAEEKTFALHGGTAINLFHLDLPRFSVVFNSQFNGMTNHTFSYEEFEDTREQVILEVNKSLTDRDKAFLLDFTKGEPVWDDVDYSMFPAIRWKLLNIRKLKESNLQKY